MFTVPLVFIVPSHPVSSNHVLTVSTVPLVFIVPSLPVSSSHVLTVSTVQLAFIVSSHPVSSSHVLTVSTVPLAFIVPSHPVSSSHVLTVSTVPLVSHRPVSFHSVTSVFQVSAPRRSPNVPAHLNEKRNKNCVTFRQPKIRFCRDYPSCNIPSPTIRDWFALCLPVM